MSTENDIEDSSIDQSEEFAPIDEGTRQNNPWAKPLSYITWGFLLTSVTLNFLMLQFIFPTIGMGLLYLGFRSLRKGNRWFFCAWIMVTIKMIWQAVQMILYATPFISIFESNIIINIVVVTFHIVLLIVFRKAIHLVFRQSSISPTRDPILSIIIWTILITIVGFSPFANYWPITIPLVLLYLVIIISLSKLGNDLFGDTEVFINAPVKVNNLMVIFGYLLSCILLVTTFCLITNHINLNESVQVPITSSEVREKLIELGFPRDILLDIPNKDVAMLNDAIYVEPHADSLAFNPIKVTTQTSLHGYSTYNVPGSCNLQASTIYIEFPGEFLYVIEYFNWTNSKAYWQDGFTISSEEGIELLSGSLLFNTNGIKYSAPIPRLKCEVVTSKGFFGTNESKQISGAVSYPYGSEYQRGYIFYRIELPEGQLVETTCMNYVHYSHPFQFPYTKTEENIYSGRLGFNKLLKQHYSYFELKTGLDAEE